MMNRLDGEENKEKEEQKFIKAAIWGASLMLWVVLGFFGYITAIIGFLIFAFFTWRFYSKN